VFTVSGNGKHASLWSVVDGSLLWSQDLYSFADMTDEKLAALQQDKDILVSAKFIKVVAHCHNALFYLACRSCAAVCVFL
jgi:hypothetical protein